MSGRSFIPSTPAFYLSISLPDLIQYCADEGFTLPDFALGCGFSPGFGGTIFTSAKR